jgi:PAP2 superfamily C-terminal
MTEIARREEEVIRPASFARIGASFFMRVALTAIALIIWFWSQKLIGNRGAPAMAIGDRLHDFTAPMNLYLHAHASAADLLLIVSSAIIDLLGIFLLARWIFGACLRPFLGLMIVLGSRQIIQWLVALPAPPNSIWHYPGFPSLLVTYSVSNDYFFSGHTAIAVLAVTEVARLGKRWLTVLGILVAIFEIATVLVLRAHYTMDVFAGIVSGLYAACLAGWISVALTHGGSEENPEMDPTEINA